MKNPEKSKGLYFTAFFMTMLAIKSPGSCPDALASEIQLSHHPKAKVQGPLKETSTYEHTSAHIAMARIKSQAFK